MKKILISALLIASALSTNAQGEFNPLTNKTTFEEMFRSVVILLLCYLVTSFILNIIKLFLDERLKKKIVETGTSEGVVAQLLPTKVDDKNSTLKWFSVLTGIAIALVIIGFTQLSGIFAAAIIAFSLAIGFLGYFFLSKYLSR